MPSRNYIIDPDQSELLMGYIGEAGSWACGETGCALYRLLKQGEIHTSNALINSKLQGYQLAMREAMHEERKKA